MLKTQVRLVCEPCLDLFIKSTNAIEPVLNLSNNAPTFERPPLRFFPKHLTEQNVRTRVATTGRTSLPVSFQPFDIKEPYF